MGQASNSVTGGVPAYDVPGYTKYYYYPIRDSRDIRPALLTGLGDYIDSWGGSCTKYRAPMSMAALPRMEARRNWMRWKSNR